MSPHISKWLMTMRDMCYGESGTEQYRKVMQHQKHQQAKHYHKTTKDLSSIETGNAVHIQLVLNMRKWIPRTITEVISARSYKVKP